MSYSDADVSAANAALDKYRSGLDYETGAALAVVGLSAERAHKEVAIPRRHDPHCPPRRCLAATDRRGVRAGPQDGHRDRRSRPASTVTATRSGLD